MIFFIIIGLAIAAIPVAMAWGVNSAWLEARKDRRVPYGKRMRQAWEKAGVDWPHAFDPALPPPKPEQLRDLVFMESFQEDHCVEIAVQEACERASSMYLNVGYTVDGAREEAVRIVATNWSHSIGYQASKRIRERVKDMPVALLLNDAALKKLHEDSDQLNAAFKTGGVEKMGAVAKDMGLGEDRTFAPTDWMECEQKALRSMLRDQDHNRTNYKKARQKAQDDDPWGAAKLPEGF